MTARQRKRREEEPDEILSVAPYRTRLDRSGIHVWDMPEGAFILSVREIDQQLVFYTLANPENKLEGHNVTFLQQGDGLRAPLEVARETYVGCARVAGVVWHVWDGELEVVRNKG